MERLFHARWWDYSDKKWNINGRICLWISLGWGLLSVIFIFGIQPLIEGLTARLYTVHALLPPAAAGVMAAALLADTAVSAKAALSIGARLEQLEKLGGLLRDRLDGLELPTEDILLRLESAYDRQRAKRLAVRNGRQARLEAWRALTPEEKRTHVAGLVRQLERRREELLRSRLQQRRLLRAFPRMRRTGAGNEGKNRLLDELRARLKKK